MNGKPWTAMEIAKLTRLYPDTATTEIAAMMRVPVYRIYGKANKLGLKKSDQYLLSPAACRLRRDPNPGIPYRFKPGHVPANKGKKGISYPGMEATQFKPGHKSCNWMPLDSLRLSKEGYLQRKVTDTGYPPHDWQGVHLLLWAEHYGPVPLGYAVGFIDGDKTHIAIDNLVLLSRRDLMRRNTIHNYPPEIKQVIRLTAKLRRTIEKRTA